MKCAILSCLDEAKKNRIPDFFGLRKMKPFDMEVVHMTEPVTVCVLPYSVDELRELKEKKRARLFQRCIRELQKREVASVYLRGDVLRLAPVEAFARCFQLPSGKAIFDFMLLDAIKWCAKKAQVDLLDAEVGIWQDCFDEHGYRILEQICGDVKYVTLYTKSDESARVFADKLYLQTGLSLKVSKKLSGLNKCDLVILTQALDKQIVHENTIVIDESGQYPFRCKNTLEFSLPFGFNTIMPYLDFADQRCMEFLLLACGAPINKSTVIQEELEKIGCRMKKVLYK